VQQLNQPTLIARFLTKYEKITDAEDDYTVLENNEDANNERLKVFYQDDLENYDPMLLSFNHSSEARRKGKFHIEYKNKYQEIIEENRNFSTQMLSLCKNQKEAKLILSSNLKQILRDVMVTSEAGLCEGKSVKICWNSYRTLGKMIYFIACFFLLPVLLIKTTFVLPFFPRGKEGNSPLQHWFYNFFSFPMNRLLSYLIREGSEKVAF